MDGRAFGHVDLFDAGLPCPPFSIAGKQLGQHDERDLFPHALRLAEQISPRTVLLENVPGLAARRFDGYRAQILRRLHGLGYQTWWQLAQASQHGVPQLRGPVRACGDLFRHADHRRQQAFHLMELDALSLAPGTGEPQQPVVARLTVVARCWVFRPRAWLGSWSFRQ